MEDLAEPRWPPGLAMMKTIDDLLRCGICFEYFNIAVIIPQCSHNYCSLCIRKFLSYKTQCPTCCVAVTEPDLRNNRLLDELVKSMSFARTRLLQFALESPPISPVSSTSKKVVVKVHNVEATQHPVKQGNRLMDKFLIRETGDCVSELLGKENERKFSPQKEISTSADIKETSLLGKTALGLSDANGPVTPSTSTLKLDTKVSCPVCGVSIPENHINKHLDSCLSREEKKESLRSSAHKRKPLPKTVYNLLSDRDLKKKLKQHGLSIQGNKQQLIKRHQEFVHMYNAQCDALHPKSAAEIVQEIENMEKTRMRLEASKLNENVMVFTKNQTEKEIEEIHSKYRKKHQNEFQLLVDQAKKGYKKTGRMSKAAVMRKDEPAETLPSERMAQEDNVSFSDTVSVTKHFPQSKVDSPGLSEPERPDDSSSCTDILLSSESDSCNSSSSDIIRDLLEEEEAWEAAHKNDQNKEVSPQQNRRTRATERAEIEPRNKRNKN
ncbi:E3 ubiquitin-protein ligase RAD18 [Rattus norvegicus]|uniref:E3 ubiquitin-protein ligase RAD18 n=1 Tax=Rattus norvegicus TaxID=10116 RepID=A0JPN0_RAT|nr:E3 ubiquitin-protein ligase RAD18 [Rattus norvegicus]AAI27511.1 RAD18 homolog (S. cerevisiae) [Rattus norvegicus]ABN81024.1 RAD18 transcript variant [Rattus norvegicus]|eukprot:NP_001071141.1 E3 ubiquitin-protein ligase RAD18 [Rattus norvegicus]